MTRTGRPPLMQDPVQIRVLIPAAVNRKLRRVAGPGNVGAWVRALIERELKEGK